MSTAPGSTSSKPPYPAIVIGVGVLLVIIGLWIGSSAAGSFIGKRSSSGFASTKPKDTGKDGSEDPIEKLPKTDNPAASKAAVDFLRDLKAGKEEDAYNKRTTQLFQDRNTLRDFLKMLQEYPTFNNYGDLQIDDKLRKAKGSLLMTGSVTSKLGTSKFTLEVVNTDDGWKVNEFRIK